MYWQSFTCCRSNSPTQERVARMHAEAPIHDWGLNGEDASLELRRPARSRSPLWAFSHHWKKPAKRLLQEHTPQARMSQIKRSPIVVVQDDSCRQACSNSSRNGASTDCKLVRRQNAEKGGQAQPHCLAKTRSEVFPLSPGLWRPADLEMCTSNVPVGCYGYISWADLTVMYYGFRAGFWPREGHTIVAVIPDWVANVTIITYVTLPKFAVIPEWAHIMQQLQCKCASAELFNPGCENCTTDDKNVPSFRPIFIHIHPSMAYQ
eukprot:6194101-Pleurochrysis_carterae.AAC.2